MSLTLFDIIVIVVVLVSGLLAMARGFVREVLSIASWVVSAIAAYYLYPSLLSVLNPSPIPDETLATIVSIAVIFIVVLIIATYATMKVADFVIDSRIGPIDRVMGLVFGGVRGLLLVVIAFVLFTWLVPVSEQPAWIATAETRPFIYNLGEQLIAVLPEDLAADLREGFAGAEGLADPTRTNPAPAAAEPPTPLPPLPENLFPPAAPAPAP